MGQLEIGVFHVSLADLADTPLSTRALLDTTSAVAVIALSAGTGGTTSSLVTGGTRTTNTFATIGSQIESFAFGP